MYYIPITIKTCTKYDTTFINNTSSDFEKNTARRSCKTLMFISVLCSQHFDGLLLLIFINNRTDLLTNPAINTSSLIDYRVSVSFFVLNQTNTILRAFLRTCLTSTTFLFFFTSSYYHSIGASPHCCRYALHCEKW